ncbi:MAG: lysophospholipid acyltransferase family protein [Deltaproteobacteria bacterium]
MRAFGKGLACFACFCAYVAAEAALTVLFFFLPAGTKRRCGARFTRAFARCLVFFLGIRVRVTGPVDAVRRLGGVFLAPNHVSYIDGFAMAATFPLVFVGKGDLRAWPLVGWMTRLSGTIFIDRGGRDRLLVSLRQMTQALAAGANLLFFPEGTTTNGEGMLPFRSAFFDAPARTGAAVAPVSIVYEAVDGAPFSRENRDRVCWYGDMTFWDHFVGLLRSRSVAVTLVVHEPLRAQPPASTVPRGPDARKDLSSRTCAAVKSGVRLLGE